MRQANLRKVTRKLPIGAELHTGGVHFRVWAPRSKTVAVEFLRGKEVERTVSLDGSRLGGPRGE